jgi:hypothetical protein
MAEPSLFRVWLPYTFNYLQVTDGCASPSKHVQVILIMGCIVGCRGCHSGVRDAMCHMSRFPLQDLARCRAPAADHFPFANLPIRVLSSTGKPGQ